MKIIKYLLFLVLILFIAGSIYIATKDGDYKVQSTSLVNAPASLLYNEVADLENWKTWNAWNNLDGITLELSENTSGEGAEIIWQADEIRNGRISTIPGSPIPGFSKN